VEKDFKHLPEKDSLEVLHYPKAPPTIKEGPLPLIQDTTLKRRREERRAPPL
jgi:hypothetical protein